MYENIVSYCEVYADKDFLVLEKNQKISYKNFLSLLDKTNGSIAKEIGSFFLGNYSIVAPNSLNYLLFFLVLQKNGGTAVNLNPNLTNSEIEDRLNLGQVSVLVTTLSIYESLKSILATTGIRKVFIFDESEAIFKEPEVVSFMPRINFKDKVNTGVSFLQFTGGTTGVTKAAVITEENLLVNLQQLNQHFKQYLDLSNLHVLVAFPFYHIFSLVFNVLYFMSNGGTCYLYHDLRNTGLIIELLKANPICFTVASNTWYKKLMQHPEFNSLDFSNIRVSLAGAEYVPLSTKNQWQNLTGKPLYSAYGLTETCSLAIVSPLDDTNDDDSIGVPLPRTEVVLLDEENEIIDFDNLAGELALKGPQLTSEYYNNPEETRKAFHNGWFKTGDIAVRINGRLYKIVDRKKDMINVSGNKIYPNEVESIISCLDEVLDVGVVAKKSEKSGEEVAACIVLKEGSALTDDEIIAYCRGFLSRYKIPKYIYRYPQLPKTAIGKTARRILRKEINNENE